jgi:hypothetical protein
MLQARNEMPRLDLPLVSPAIKQSVHTRTPVEASQQATDTPGGWVWFLRKRDELAFALKRLLPSSQPETPQARPEPRQPLTPVPHQHHPLHTRRNAVVQPTSSTLWLTIVAGFVVQFD